MLRTAWDILKDTAEGFIADEAMTRGAAIACYTMFSLAPLLVVAVAIAGLAFGEAAVHGALGDQLRALVGRAGADAVQAMVAGAGGGAEAGSVAGLVSLGVLLLTASGVFVEIQAALNAVWKAVPQAISVSTLVKARLLGIGLVGTTGFLLLVSLFASAMLAAVEAWARGRMPEVAVALGLANLAISFGLTTLLFGAMYKILPDRRLEWRDVLVGALITALLFTIGKTMIGWYLGGSGVAARYGAAGAIVIVLLWIYYSAQIFLLGAEFTRAWAARRGNRRPVPPVSDGALGQGALGQGAPGQGALGQGALGHGVLGQGALGQGGSAGGRGV